MTSRAPPPGPAAATSADRLAQSRLAILDYLQHTRQGNARPTGTGDPPSAGSPPRGSGGSGGSSWSGLREAARRYWGDHPARLVAGLVAPVVSHWGRRHPLALVALAAGVGAALVLARPWKLISVTGVLVAALKSPHLASMALSALASSRTPTQGRHPR